MVLAIRRDSAPWARASAKPPRFHDRVLLMRPRGIQHATETSQERDRRTCFRSGLRCRNCYGGGHGAITRKAGRPTTSHSALRDKLRSGVYIRPGV